MIHKFNSKKASHAMKRAAQMPALFHSLPDQDFDSAKSEVVRWLCEQWEIRQAMFDYYKDKGAIVFDRAIGKWKGCNTP